MSIDRMDRRAVLMTSGAFLAVNSVWPTIAVAGDAAANLTPAAPPALAPDFLKKAAEKLATEEFVKPAMELPAPFNKLSYDQYRDIRFRTEQSIWRSAKDEPQKSDFELQLFPMGWLYESPVALYLIEDGKSRPLVADGKLFELGPLIGPGPEAAPFGFSGFRIHAPINRADYFDEFVVFQGASYLRAVARGQQYGMSARGLALNTARPGGEEFPLFRGFWIEKPAPGATEIVVHALLDSPSTTGAYRFAIQPGQATVMDVEATLYPRKSLQSIGIGPLTSMFLTGPAHKRVTGDFRPAVHDSEGLAVLNGKGERLWRPLTNPKKLQMSAFVDSDPKGFGLAQRERSFTEFEDLEARYERRPTVWVEPKGGWGAGAIELIEIPVEEEIHDNIVAYWRPEKPLEAGTSHTFAYKLYWAEDVPVAWTGARVAATRIGTAPKKEETTIFVIDFDGPAVKDIKELPVAELSASAGTTANVVVQRHPDIGGLRVSFELATADQELIELRLALKEKDQLISESWLYRWTRS